MIEYTQEVEDAINADEFELIRESLDSGLLSVLIEDDRFDLVDKLSEFFKSTEDMHHIIFNAVIESAGNNITQTSVKCLNFLLSEYPDREYAVDEFDFVYYMCQSPGNVELLELIIKLKTDMDWGYVLQNSCSFVEKDSVYFVIKNAEISNEDINNAFGSLVNSSVMKGVYDNPIHKELVAYFLDDLNIDVNLKVDNGWEWIYLDCFRKVPTTAKKFYTKDFDSTIINNECFWNELLSALSSSNKLNKVYLPAFSDLKESSIDLTELINLFNLLGYQKLAEELLI